MDGLLLLQNLPKEVRINHRYCRRLQVQRFATVGLFQRAMVNSVMRLSCPRRTEGVVPPGRRLVEFVFATDMRYGIAVLLNDQRHLVHLRSQLGDFF